MTTIFSVIAGIFGELIWKFKGSPYQTYYTSEGGVKTLAELKGEMKSIRDRGLILPYRVGVYDCSEMGAQLERHLENRGYKTYACYGDVTGRVAGKSERHMWLKVQCKEGLILVEPTGRGVANLAKYQYNEERCSDRIWDLGLAMHEVDFWRELETVD